MSVWSHLGDPEVMARVLRHPAHDAVTHTVASLITVLRATSTREELRPVQESLASALVDAESRFREQSRLSKRHQGDPVNLTFWRRACVQLRAVGDAIAWRFLGYRRQWIVLMGRNQRPGLMSDKAGFDTEWQLFTEHWDAGEPTLLTGLSNCITLSDLLVARGDVLWSIEAKRNLSRSRPQQTERLRELRRLLNEAPRIVGPDGPSWVLESAVPLVSHWTWAEPHLQRAVSEGVASWVPTPGLGVLFISWRAGASLGRAGWERALKREREAAQALVGSDHHRVVVRSNDYPYRPNRAAPFSIFPVAAELAAMLLTSEASFIVEVHIERLVDELRAAGMEARNLLVGQPDGGPAPRDIIEWRSATGRGVLHPGAMEQLGVELTDPPVWATSLARVTRPPGGDRRSGFYISLASEHEVWR